MKNGFRIVCHKSIKDSEQFISVISQIISYMNNGYGCGWWGYLFRNKIGLQYTEDWKRTYYTNDKAKYTFKRLSKRRRIFGFVPLSILDIEDEEKTFICHTISGCKVKLKTPYQHDIDNYTTLYETGEIKG